MTQPSVRLAQLVALRAQVDALIMAEEHELGMVQPQGCPNCGSHEESQDTSTFGVPRKRCQACGHEWELAA